MTRRSRSPVVKRVLMLAVVASFAHMLWWFTTRGYLPQPFVFDTSDTFMDGFNTACWANRPGACDVWRSIYPPLSFVFLDWTSLPAAMSARRPGARLRLARAGDDPGSLSGGRCGLVVAFRRADPHTAIPRTVAIALGLPLLFTLERGNLIWVALPAFEVAHGSVTRSRAWRAIGTAVTINLKPYLVLPAFAHALRREWRPLELAGIGTILLYLVTLALVGSGSPMELASNTVNWVSFVAGQIWNKVNYSTSYAPLLLMRESQLPLLDFVPSRTIETAVPLAIR